MPYALQDALTVASRLRTLLDGSLIEQGAGSQALVEYRLADGSGVEAFTHLDRSAARSCLRNRSVVLLGDSRLRYLFASLGTLILGAAEYERESHELGLPKYRACPYSNVLHKTSPECSQFYSRCGNVSCHDLEAINLMVESTQLSYVFNNWAHTASRATAVTRSTARPVDVLLANVGAWGVFAAKGLAPGFNVTSTQSDRLSGMADLASIADFYSTVRQVQAPVNRPAGAGKSSQGVAIAVGYPECGCGRQHTRLCVNKFAFNVSVRDALYSSGWLTYHPTHPTSSLWAERKGGFGKAWSTDIQPVGTLPHIAKWDQCQSVHSFDTLADLEVQLLLNALCARSRAL